MKGLVPRTAPYVHGHGAREAERLRDQADTLAALIHDGTRYPVGHTVLEAGCGTGAQTVSLARHNPGSWITSIDRSATSLAQAQARVEQAGFANVTFREADLLALPFAPASFDHVFVCFVLEHLPDPAAALAALARVLRPGGSLTVVEGDHGTACMFPHSDAAHRAVGCLVELQRRAGGDALIGRRLHPLLAAAGFASVDVAARTVHAVGGSPGPADTFTRKTFTAMVDGVRDAAIAEGLATASDFATAVRDLDRTADAGGVFVYTFFKGTAVKR